MILSSWMILPKFRLGRSVIVCLCIGTYLRTYSSLLCKSTTVYHYYHQHYHYYSLLPRGKNDIVSLPNIGRQDLQHPYISLHHPSKVLHPTWTEYATKHRYHHLIWHLPSTRPPIDHDVISKVKTHLPRVRVSAQWGRIVWNTNHRVMMEATR